MPREDEDIFQTGRSHLTYREWHTFVNGGYIGLVGYPERATIRHVDRYYWRGGFIVGWSIKVVGILAVGQAII